MTNYVGKLAEVKCISINQRRPDLLAVGANDPYARIFDRRMITLSQVAYHNVDDGHHVQHFIAPTATDTIPRACVQYYCPGHFTRKPASATTNRMNKTITYLTFSPDGNELLVNIGSEQIYLFDLNNAKRPEALQMPQIDKTTTTDEPQESATNARNTNRKAAADVLKVSGNKCLEKEQYLLAIAKYSAAIRVAPDYAALYLNRATAYMRRNWYGDVYEALRDCQRAVQLDDGYVKAHFRLARALMQLDRPEEASEYMDALLARYPEHSHQSGVMMLHKEIHMAVIARRQLAEGCSAGGGGGGSDDDDDDSSTCDQHRQKQICSVDELVCLNCLNC